MERLLLAATLLLLGCGRGVVDTGGGQAVVERVVDGDTIDVAVGGRHERVRLLGIDTPELYVERDDPECFGREASAFTKRLLAPGTAVRLERDVVGRDDYGRLLAYVYVRGATGEVMANSELVRNGLARPLSIAPNRAHAARFAADARAAEAAGLGLWDVCGIAFGAVPVATSTLAERLGHSADARLVIVSCDDLGLCHAANIGVYRAVRDGAATCASLMVPAPWSRHAASMYEPGDDIGVHLTLNAEHENYRFGPITHAPSLLSGDGGFPRSIDDLWEHADPDEVRRECRAQIERALAWGIDVTHLAPHLTAITLRPEFFDVYLEMAVEFRLPIRLPSTITADQAGFPFRRLAADEGVVFPDHFDHDWRAGSRERVRAAIRDLEPGVTEIHVQPAVDTPEVRALSPAAEGWIDDLALVEDASIPRLLAEVGAVQIGFSELRDAQRAS